MKKFLGIVVLGFLLHGCAPTPSTPTFTPKYEWPKKTDYYNFLEPTGPTTIDSAIELLKKRSDPDLIEGVWIDKSNFIMTVIQEDNNYSIYRLKSPGIKKAGYKDGTIFKGASKTEFMAREAQATDNKISCVSNASYLIINSNELQLSVHGNCVDTKTWKINYKRLWPKNNNQSEVTENEPGVVEAGSGTAFFINNQGHLITNFHVIKGCNNQSKIIYKNKEIKVNLVAKDQHLDLALLKADVKNDLFLKISNQSPKKLQKVVVAGHPLGKLVSDDLKIENGIITALKGPGDDSTLLQTNVAINFGNSGGPIVYEKNGEVVAVAVSGLRKDITESINFGIKSLSVKNFLESNSMNIPTASNELSLSNDELVELLEGTTLYTFCE